MDENKIKVIISDRIKYFEYLKDLYQTLSEDISNDMRRVAWGKYVGFQETKNSYEELLSIDFKTLKYQIEEMIKHFNHLSVMFYKVFEDGDISDDMKRIAWGKYVGFKEATISYEGLLQEFKSDDTS